MGYQHTHFKTWNEELTHRKTVIKKLEKIQGLQALYESWEANPVDSDEYRHYMLLLRRRLRSAENQLRAMKP
jgi:hypothetical protein